MHHPLHQFVPYHEIGGAGVFIDQQQRGSGFDGFHHVGCLGGAAAGVFGVKAAGIPAAGQIVDEKRDIRVVDTASVLCADLHGGVVGDDVFPPIPFDMVVYAQFQRF